MPPPERHISLKRFRKLNPIPPDYRDRRWRYRGVSSNPPRLSSCVIQGYRIEINCLHCGHVGYWRAIELIDNLGNIPNREEDRSDWEPIVVTDTHPVSEKGV